MGEAHRTADPRRALGGPGIMLVVLYAVLALAATGRSILQITSYFEQAPLAYLLSAFAAVVYLLATWCLARGGRWVRVGVVACTIELVGVLVVGTASYLFPDAFPTRRCGPTSARGTATCRSSCPCWACCGSAGWSGWRRRRRPRRRAQPSAESTGPPSAQSTRPPEVPPFSASAGSRRNTGMSRSVFAW